MKLHLIKTWEVNSYKRVLYAYQLANLYIGPILDCCPTIVRGSNGSVIQPFTGWTGNVVLIVKWSNWTVNDKEFRAKLVAIHIEYNASYMYFCCDCRCCVIWGDGGNLQCKNLYDSEPCQMFYQYEKVDSQYTVVAYYCYSGSGSQCPPTICCKSYTRSIDISHDPGKPLFQSSIIIFILIKALLCDLRNYSQLAIQLTPQDTEGIQLS